MSGSDKVSTETNNENIVENDIREEIVTNIVVPQEDTSTCNMDVPNEANVNNNKSLMDCDNSKEPNIKDDDINLDGILELVDGIEGQVEHFREKVKLLQDEKLSLQSTVNFVSQMVETNISKYQNGTIDSSTTNLEKENLGLSKVDCDEIKASLNRISKRIDAVQVNIVTTRDEDQAKSLEKMNVIIR